MRRVLPFVCALLLGACDFAGHVQSPLNAAGQGADDVLGLWRFMLVTFSIVYVAVMGLGAWAILRRRQGEAVPRPANQVLWIGVGGLAVPGVILTVLLVLTLSAMAAEARWESREADLTISVVAHKWWWQVDYEHREPQQRVRTANEIHIPVGRDVRVKLHSRDIIHSFWVPALAPKIDMIPGRYRELMLRADAPGVFRGQCAEFCGMQHANMAFLVVAQEPEEFERWYARQLQPARAPQTELELRGMQVFMEKPCAVCHAVRGTLALATAGPDLTHFGSRRTLAAGALPNTRGNLGGWITHPQSIKPGSHMPDIDLGAGELLALLAYLESLQ